MRIDPDSFSSDQVYVEDGSGPAMVDIQRGERETTPLRDVSSHTPMIGTPLGSDLAKRGILRSSGTPGSGNGGEL